jgi:phosphatidylserine/phosphatidylglycerophosphate/cardiolipin synthase-like enzyme
MVEKEPKPEQFFLPEDDINDDLRFRAPTRPNTQVRPLIDGIPTFVEIEQAIADAKESVYLSLWIFQPEMALQSRKVRATNIRTWRDLLVGAAARGVNVCVLISDFDPIFAPTNHRMAWSAYRILMAGRATLKDEQQGLLQVVCSRHGATVSAFIGDEIKRHLDGLVAHLNTVLINKGLASASALFKNMPGLWPSVRFNRLRKQFTLTDKPEIVAYPATHHQKMAVIDSTLGYCGGIDIAKGRLDTPLHEGMGWHDVHCEVQGTVVLDMERNFRARWNRERLPFERFVRAVNRLPESLGLPEITIKGLFPPANKPTKSKTWAPGQIHRTLSEGGVRPVPSNVRRDIYEAYEQAISLASHFIYIENQYVRAPQLADWLIARQKNVPDLQVIIVLPVAPEEVARGKLDPVTAHGLALQYEVLTRLRTNLKDNLGLFSMVRRETAKGGKGWGGKSPTNAFGSAQVYVHSKCMVVDDVYAMIGSANTNPRSFLVDTELNIAWYEPNSVSRFRRLLWQELLGAPTSELDTWPVREYVRRWKGRALQNSRAKPEQRKGFVIPHDPDNSLWRGEKSQTIPDEMAQIFDYGSDDQTPGSLLA